jgi:uncharacterized protein YjdB
MKVRTSVLRGFALLALSSLTFAACDEKTPAEVIPPAVTVTVSPQAVSVPVGGQATLVAFVGNSTNQAVTWQSTNPAIVTVDANGVVRGVAPGGPVTVIATSAADQNARAAASVTVTPGAPVTLTLVPQTASVEMGRTVQLVGIVGGSTNQTVNYTSSAPAVATVSPTGGLVTGVSAGTAVITARTAADANVFQTSTITVTTAPGTGPAQISVTPSTASVQVGASQTYVATVSGVANTAVTWRNETPTIASFTQTGNNITATGLAAGTAIFTAISAADTTRRVQATMTVTAAPIATQPAISIQSVTWNNQAIASGAVVNSDVVVVVNVSAGSEARIGRVEVRLGEQVACQQVFSPPLSQTQGVSTITCVINTRQTNAQGQPLFPNGTYSLSAVAFNETGTPVATAQWGTLFLNNVSGLGLSVTTQGVAGPGSVFVDGVLWREGDVIVRASPLIFQAGQQVTAVTLCIQATNGPEQTPACRVATLADGVFTATFPKATAPGNVDSPGSAGITTNRLEAYGSSTFATGAAGPQVQFTQSASWIRLDNVAPWAGVSTTMIPGTNENWVRGEYTFNARMMGAATPAQATVIDVTDIPVGCETTPRICVGVGLPGGVTFHAVPTAQFTALTGNTADQQQQLAAYAAAHPAFTNVQNLPETTTPTAYRLVVAVRDRLGNVAYFLGSEFGVDRTAPALFVNSGSPINNHVNPQINPSGGLVGLGGPVTYTFTFEDVHSDVPPNPLWVRLVRHYGMGAPTCYDVNTKALVDPNALPAGAVTEAGACPWIRLVSPDGFRFDMTGLPEGVWQVQIRAVDRAGNLSNVVTRTHVIDTTAPVLDLPPFSGTLTASDSVGLRKWDQRLRFAGYTNPAPATVHSLPVTAPELIADISTTNRVMNRTFTLAGTTPTIWRGIEVTGTVYAMNGWGFGVWDLGWNFAEFFASYTPTSVNNRAYDALVSDATAGSNPPGSLGTFTLFRSTANPLRAPTNRQVGSTAWGPAAWTTTNTSASITLWAAALGNTGTNFRRPFRAVHYYRVENASGHVYYLGQATSPTVTFPGGAQAEYEWEFTWVPQNDTNVRAGDHTFFAVGVDFDGDARRTDNVLMNTVWGGYQQQR